LQIFHEDGSPDIFALYSGDLGERLLSYASGMELCKIEVLNKRFSELTTDAWVTVTNDRFGMKNGKEGWKLGTSFLRKPVFIYINMSPDHHSMYYAGFPNVTSHNSLFAVVTDVREDEDYEAPEGINMYNANNLKYIGYLEQDGSRTTMAGPAGDEVFITNNNHDLSFCRHNFDEQYIHYANNMARNVPVLGCRTHVIVVTGNTLKLYKLTSNTNDSTYVLECQSVSLGRACNNDDIDENGFTNEYFNNSISWGRNEFDFVVYHSVDNWRDGVPGTCEISVWGLDALANQITRTQYIEARIGLENVAMSEDFIVGASKDKKMHVWNRHTKEKLPYILCDVDEEDELDDDDIISPICMSIHGHILVANSHLGAALCIWNVKTGQLLRKYNDAVEEGRTDLLPDGPDASSMAYLKQLNGFILTTGYLNVWAFPTNQVQKDKVLAIRTREEDLRQNARNERPIIGLPDGW
jgi:hypothetical protein